MQDRQIEQEAGALPIFPDGQLPLKLPHHAGDDLEAQTGARLIDVEPFGEPRAMVGDFDVEVSIDFPS